MNDIMRINMNYITLYDSVDEFNYRALSNNYNYQQYVTENFTSKNTKKYDYGNKNFILNIVRYNYYTYSVLQ